MPLYKLLEEMPYTELLGWYAYFERRPPEWRGDDRIFKLMQAWGVKGKPWSVFPTLEPIYIKPKDEAPKFNVASFKKSALFNKILGAKGGDKLDL